MKNRKSITLSAVLYTMLKQWKVMLIVFIIIAVIGSGYTVLTKKKNNTSAGTENAIATLEKNNKAAVDGYGEHLVNSAYMNLDPSNLHTHYMYYKINWKEQGLSPEGLESKNDSLFQIIRMYYTSDEFANEIASVNEAYKEKALYEVIGLNREGSRLLICVDYTDDYYVKSLSDIIDSTLKKKMPEWIKTVGSFEITPESVVDKPVDGFTSGHKSVQDSKRKLLEQHQSDVEAAAITQKTTKEAPLFRQLIVVIIVAILAGIIVGGITAIYRRRFDTSTDVYDITGDDVLCVLKSEPEKGLDKLHYKKNDKYHDPELYLSIADRKMADSEIKKVYIYNCSEADASTAAEKIAGQLKSVEVVNVDKESSRDFFLKMTDKEEVLLLVKAGMTDKREFLRMREHLTDIGVKSAGVVFAV